MIRVLQYPNSLNHVLTDNMYNTSGKGEMGGHVFLICNISNLHYGLLKTSMNKYEPSSV